MTVVGMVRSLSCTTGTPRHLWREDNLRPICPESAHSILDDDDGCSTVFGSFAVQYSDHRMMGNYYSNCDNPVTTLLRNLIPGC